MGPAASRWSNGCFGRIRPTLRPCSFKHSEALQQGLRSSFVQTFEDALANSVYNFSLLFLLLGCCFREQSQHQLFIWNVMQWSRPSSFAFGRHGVLRSRVLL